MWLESSKSRPLLRFLLENPVGHASPIAKKVVLLFVSPSYVKIRGSTVCSEWCCGAGRNDYNVPCVLPEIEYNLHKTSFSEL